MSAIILAGAAGLHIGRADAGRFGSDDHAFLAAYYAAARLHLERRLLFGQRKRDKFDSASSMSDTQSDIAGVIASPPLIFIGMLLLGVALEFGVVRTQGLGMPASLRWTVAAPLFVAGVGLIVAVM